MIVETWGQDSAIKGLRIVDFEVEEHTNRKTRIWINDDGTRSFRYGVQELINSGWILLDSREEKDR